MIVNDSQCSSYTDYLTAQFELNLHCVHYVKSDENVIECNKMKKIKLTIIIPIIERACAPFCPEIPADGNNRDKRRKPNPLRLAGRVFNFQDHQYVPRNTPPRMLQSLSGSLGALSLHSSFFSFSLMRNASRIDNIRSPSLLLSFTVPSLFRSDNSADGAPEGDAAYIYHFTKPHRLHGIHCRNKWTLAILMVLWIRPAKDEERGERIRCFRRDPPLADRTDRTHSPPAAFRSAREPVFILLAPRRSRPNGAPSPRRTRFIWISSAN